MEDHASLETGEPLPGPAKSWVPGESTRDMPSADVPAASSTPAPDQNNPAAAASVALGRVDEVSAGLADIKRQEISANDRVYGKLAADIDSGIAKAKAAAEAAGIEPGTLKPWNAEEESAKRQTDPIAAFGSLGSVFGILASAFTHAPMENALNASAAAINAIKQGNEKDYERAYKAWQDNTKLALDKHKIQHEQYQDAVELLKLNMAAGEAKMRVLAAKFGDEKTLFLLENGMSKEVIDLQASREKLALDLQTNRNKVALENFKMSTLMNDPRYKAPVGSPERQALIHEFQEQWGNRAKSTPVQMFSERWLREHSDATAEDYGKAMAGFMQATKVTGSTTATKVALDKFLAENPEASPDQISAFLRSLKGPSDTKIDLEKNKLAIQEARQKEIARHNSEMERLQNSRGDVQALRAKETERHNRAMENISHGRTDLTGDRQIAADVNSIIEKYKTEHPDATPDEIAEKRTQLLAHYKSAASAPSGNRIDDLKGKINQVDLALNTINHIEDMLKKHNAIVGLGGKVTRPAEVINNIFGGNETDRKQTERWISELQEIAPRILLDSKGRPLSSEAGRVETIIAGLRFGDTTANTARAYYEFRKVLQQIRSGLSDRMRVGPASNAPTAPAPAPPEGDWWKSAPVVH